MERGEVERKERMVNTEGSVYYNSSKNNDKNRENMPMSFDKVPWNPPQIIIPSFLRFYGCTFGKKTFRRSKSTNDMQCSESSLLIHLVQ